jgi:hypothetical protein
VYFLLVVFAVFKECGEVCEAAQALPMGKAAKAAIISAGIDRRSCAAIWSLVLIVHPFLSSLV